MNNTNSDPQNAEGRAVKRRTKPARKLGAKNVLVFSNFS